MKCTGEKKINRLFIFVYYRVKRVGRLRWWYVDVDVVDGVVVAGEKDAVFGEIGVGLFEYAGRLEVVSVCVCM